MSITYCDLEINFKKNVYGVVKNVYNANSVKQSIFTILQTRKGERVMRPDFGSNLYALLFQPMDDDTVSDIRYEVFNAISEWEDRVIIEEIMITPYYAENQYVINMTYNVINTPYSENVSIGLVPNV